MVIIRYFQVLDLVKNALIFNKLAIIIHMILLFVIYIIAKQDQTEISNVWTNMKILLLMLEEMLEFSLLYILLHYYL